MLVEPVSGPKPYPLRTAADVLAVVDRVRSAGASNVGFLCDLFHLANNGDDIDAAISDQRSTGSRHVQIADHPGRGEPGSGNLDLDRLPERRSKPAATPAMSPWSTTPDHHAREPGLAARRAPRLHLHPEERKNSS